jgi:hypothetical protein
MSVTEVSETDKERLNAPLTAAMAEPTRTKPLKSNKWRYVMIVAVATVGIGCTATGIGAIVGIPLIAISGIAAVSLL